MTVPRLLTIARIASQRAQAVNAAAPDEPLQGRERVLLVEDEPVVRNLVHRMLERNGYDVVEAEDGAAALEQARGLAPIDLLLTDVVMPNMSGRELADRIREIHPETLVLYTSGYTDTAIIGEDELGDRTQFLQKPFGMTELTEKIRLLVDRA